MLGTLSNIPGCNPISNSSEMVTPCEEANPPRPLPSITIYHIDNGKVVGTNDSQPVHTNVAVATGVVVSNSAKASAPSSSGSVQYAPAGSGGGSSSGLPIEEGNLGDSANGATNTAGAGDSLSQPSTGSISTTVIVGAVGLALVILIALA